MDDRQIQDIVDRVLVVLQDLAPREPSVWADFAALTPLAALTAAVVAAVVGYRNLKQQQAALNAQVSSHDSTLTQKSEADARSEWWRRTQWALEAAASDNPVMYGYGAGMLDLLAQSDLAGLHDKELLDAVWEVTSTEMQDEGIEQLIRDAREQEDLSYEELVSVLSFDQVTRDKLAGLRPGAGNLSYDELAGMLRRYQDVHDQDNSDTADATGEVTAAASESVDEKLQSGDNEDSKEDDDDNPQIV